MGEEKAGPGDTVRMPRNLPHAYYNRGDVPTRGLFLGQSGGPAGRTVRQAARPHDPAEVVRLSAECDVEFLPPGSVEGA